MIIKFEKYQGTGNDFIIIDNKDETFDKQNVKLINYLCNRRFGIGADGLLLLENHSQYAFEMVYFNADGNLSSMCGNGGRCIAKYAFERKIINKSDIFYAIDGEHHVEIIDDENVCLKLLVYGNIEPFNNDFIVETGSPHYVAFKNNIEVINLVDEAKKIRYSEPFTKKGINVNFVDKALHNNLVNLRTYERGVEAETLSCRTGTVAVAIVAKQQFAELSEAETINLKTKGGLLKVHFKDNGVWLSGPATAVFKGEIDLNALIININNNEV